MKAVVSLILMMMCIAAKSDSEGVTDYLKTKWRELHTIINQFYSRQCYRNCSLIENDGYWNALAGNTVLSLSESKYLEYLEDLFNADPVEFIESVHKNATLGTKFLDADHDNKISAEEYYTEFLCMGVSLDVTKKQFDSLLMQPMDDSIPNYRFIFFWVDYMTNGLETDKVYDTMRNISLAFNDADHI